MWCPLQTSPSSAITPATRLALEECFARRDLSPAWPNVPWLIGGRCAVEPLRRPLEIPPRPYANRASPRRAEDHRDERGASPSRTFRRTFSHSRTLTPRRDTPVTGEPHSSRTCRRAQSHLNCRWRSDALLTTPGGHTVCRCSPPSRRFALRRSCLRTTPALTAVPHRLHWLMSAGAVPFDR